MQKLLETWKDERPVFVEGDYLETMGRFLDVEQDNPPRGIKIDASDVYEFLQILESSESSQEQLIQLMEVLTQKLANANIFLDVATMGEGDDTAQPRAPES